MLATPWSTNMRSGLHSNAMLSPGSSTTNSFTIAKQEASHLMGDGSGLSYTTGSPAEFVTTKKEETVSWAPNSNLYFPQRLFRMLTEIDMLPEKRSMANIVSWHPSGSSFIIFRTQEFVSKVMPVYFSTQSKFMSFKRQLNNYGFERIKGQKHLPEALVFYHKRLIRGEPFLCESIQLKSKSKHQDPAIETSKRITRSAVQVVPSPFQPSLAPLTYLLGMVAGACSPPTCSNLVREETPLQAQERHHFPGNVQIQEDSIRIRIGSSSCEGESDSDDGDYILDEVVTEILGNGEDDDMTSTNSIMSYENVEKDDETRCKSTCPIVFDNVGSICSSSAESIDKMHSNSNKWDPNVESLECVTEI